MTDNHNGTYTTIFTATTTGTNTVIASLGGKVVTSAPPAVTVTPGAVSLSQSSINLATTSLPSGNTAIVTLTVRDANGNQETSGGLSVAFALGSDAAGGTFSAVTDNHNGTYSAIFTATVAGTNTVSAKIGGQVVTSTSPNVVVTAGPASLTQSTVTAGASTAQAGSTATATLTARDASGNRETGGGLAVIFTTGPGDATGTFTSVTDNHDGTYTSTFTAIKAGTVTLSATIGGQAVLSSGPSITVTPGAVSLSQSSATVSPVSIPAGSTSAWTLTARDASGNQQTGGGLTVAFALGTGSAGGTIGPVIDNHNGPTPRFSPPRPPAQTRSLPASAANRSAAPPRLSP